jgi:hypothetical protein
MNNNNPTIYSPRVVLATVALVSNIYLIWYSINFSFFSIHDGAEGIAFIAILPIFILLNIILFFCWRSIKRNQNILVELKSHLSRVESVLLFLIKIYVIALIFILFLLILTNQEIRII